MLPPPAATKPKIAHRLRPLGRLGEQGHHQRERDRRDDRAAEPLHRPRPDEQRLRVCQPAGERGHREERDADQEQPSVAEEVAQPATEQQKAAEGEQVGVHDPGQRRLGEAEILPDRGQRDVRRSSYRGRSSGRPGRGREAPANASGCPWPSGTSPFPVASHEHQTGDERETQRSVVHDPPTASAPRSGKPCGSSRSCGGSIVMFGSSAVEPARDVPRLLAQQGEERGHERHPHDQRVREDRDREQQPELLRDAIGA